MNEGISHPSHGAPGNRPMLRLKIRRDPSTGFADNFEQ